MAQVKKYFEKAFWLLLLISPALDMINGIWTYKICGGTGGMLSSLDIKNIPGMSPSFLIRIAFLLMMVAYLFLQKKWKAIGMFCVIGVCWIGTVAGEFFRGVEFSLMADIQYITRFCYCLVVVIAYSTMLKQDKRSPESLRGFVDKVLCGSLIVLGLGVLVPYILGMGFYTYADPLGYRGSRGFFYAGNDITAVMMLMLPVVLVGWMEQKNVKKAGYPWLQAISAALGLMSMLIIGTKTSFLAAAVTLIVMGGYSLFMGLRKKDWQTALRLLVVLLLVLAILLVLLVVAESSPLETIWRSLSATKQYTEIADVETVVLSGRTNKLDLAVADFKAGLPLTGLVGMGRGSQAKIIEMDLIEVALYYGVLGAVAMLWLYLFQGVMTIVDLFRAFTLRNLAVCVALGLAVGYLFLAGHILFSVTAGFYFAFMIVYARLFCSKDGMDTNIL